MSVRAENRWKAKNLAEFHAATAAQRQTEVLREPRPVRHPIPKLSSTTSTKGAVRRWMRLHASEYETATELAEGCNIALDLPMEYLDDPGHWVWDLALTQMTGMDWSKP